MASAVGVGLESAEVRMALGLPGESISRTYTSVSTDTRTLRAGALFIALKGDRVDGADLLAEAAHRGALGAVVPESRRPQLSELEGADLEWFPVPDVLRALGNLAAHHRRRSPARVVAVTGSSGKTTVREMTACAVGAVRRVHRTEGNLNSQVGLPLTILEAPPQAEIWVLELGSSEPGEIARLAEVAAPDDALVTTVGPAHLEGLGDEEGVLREKLALVERTSPSGTVIVGEHPARLVSEARRLRADTVVAGLGAEADWVPERSEIGVTSVAFERGGVTYRVAVGGEHHLRDAVLAAAMADRLGVSGEDAARGLARFRPLPLRGELRRYGALSLVADCYNANPESFAAAIDYCRMAFPERRRVAVVGTMLELGSRAAEAHRDVARRLLEAGFKVIVATGEFREPAADLGAGRAGVTVVPALNAEEAWTGLLAELTGDEVVLLKASRGVHLEWIADRIAAEFGGERG